MPLTPEDVVNKRFQPTKFREGYDQDEVDDFLDEIVVELRRLNQENEIFASACLRLRQESPSCREVAPAWQINSPLANHPCLPSVHSPRSVNRHRAVFRWRPIRLKSTETAQTIFCS